MKHKNHSGFTIIELMLTIALGAVLLSLAVPSYTTMVKNNCLTAKTNGVITAIQLARSTAITRRTDIAFAPTCTLDATAAACTDATNEFGDGVIVYQDFNGDGFPDSTVDEDLNSNGTLDPGEDINLNGVLDTDLTEIVRASEFGCAATVNETGDNIVLIYDQTGSISPIGTFDVCDDRDGTTYSGRQISMTTTGRAATDSEYNGCP
ncbi:MAG: GspH/FimT family pseudopilin [Pseudomonadota bacterium]